MPTRQQGPDNTAPATPRSGAAIDEAPPRNRVLVVDDDAPVRRMFQRVLEFGRFDVIATDSGAEAIDLLRNDPSIGLVLLDLMMPGMDGWRFRHAQSSDPRLAAIPTIIVTGCDTPQAVRDELQAADYLTKPVPMARLIGAVSAFCRSRDV